MTHGELMRVTCSLMAIAFIMTLVSSTWAVPLEDFTDLDEEDDKRLLLSKVFGLNRQDLDSQHSTLDLMEPRQTRNFAPKRRRPYQVRSKGLSLCLWKVCPAAPWLVKRF